MNRILLFLTALLLFSCKGKNEDTASESTLRPVKYAKLSYSDGVMSHTFSGIAQSDQESKLSFRVPGSVRTLNVKLGDRVRKGQLIATIDPADYNIQADQANASAKGAEANLKAAESQLIIARSTYQRVEKLYETNSVPLSEFEKAKSQYESAKSQFDAAKTTVTSANKQSQSARNQVNYTKLLAPFKGVITAVLVEANEMIGSGTPVAVLSSESRPEVKVGVPESIISKISQGQKAQIRFSALTDQNFSGTVKEISFAAGSSPTYPAIIGIDEPTPGIRPGMAATVVFEMKSKSDQPRVLVCQASAMGEDDDGNFVFVLEPDQNSETHIAKKRTVEVGTLLKDGFAIKAGLKEGELIATAGLRSLLDGMEVKLMEN